MADDISNYKFDFKNEVEDLRQGLRSKADNLMFINVEVEKSHVEGVLPNAILRQVIAGKGIRDKDASQYPEWAIEEYIADPDKNTYNQPILDFDADRENPPTIGHEICVKVDGNEIWNFECGNNSFLQLFGFYHEIGHALISDHPKIDKNHPLGEAGADAYATICCLQKFGQDAVPILSMISWNRAFDAIILGETSHVTTTVIDKIIADSAHRDFSKLTPAETIALAEEYAIKWTPTVSTLSSARRSFLPEEAEELDFSLLHTTALTSPPNNFAFYVAAKAFNPFLQPGGVVFNGEPFQFPDSERQKYKATIAERASGMSLAHIFNASALSKLHGIFKPTAKRSAAKALLTETLKVASPAGQPFTIKF